jgi:hypothetical protein
VFLFILSLAYELYASQSIIGVIKSRRMRWTGHVERMGEMKYACKFFVGKHRGRRSGGGPKLRWEDNFRMDLRDVG